MATDTITKITKTVTTETTSAGTTTTVTTVTITEVTSTTTTTTNNNNNEGGGGHGSSRPGNSVDTVQAGDLEHIVQLRGLQLRDDDSAIVRDDLEFPAAKPRAE